MHKVLQFFLSYITVSVEKSFFFVRNKNTGLFRFIKIGNSNYLEPNDFLRPRSKTGRPRPTSESRKVEAWTAKKRNDEFISFLPILEYEKNNSETHTAMLLSFMLDLVKEFEAKFAKIDQLSQFLKSPYKVALLAEWTDKLFTLEKALFPCKCTKMNFLKILG